MSNTRTRRPVSDTRPARRSLVELTAAASRAIDNGLLATSGSLMAASPDDQPRLEQAANAPDPTVVVGQATAPIQVAAPKSPSAAASRRGGLVDSDSSAEMMVKIAKDYRNRAFENIKVSLNAALDLAKDFVEPAASKDGDGSSLESNF
jgi:hypothetical protein